MCYKLDILLSFLSLCVRPNHTGATPFLSCVSFRFLSIDSIRIYSRQQQRLHLTLIELFPRTSRCHTNLFAGVETQLNDAKRSVFILLF